MEDTARSSIGQQCLSTMTGTNHVTKILACWPKETDQRPRPAVGGVVVGHRHWERDQKSPRRFCARVAGCFTQLQGPNLCWLKFLAQPTYSQASSTGLAIGYMTCEQSPYRDEFILNYLPIYLSIYLSIDLSIYYYLFNIESLKNRGMPLLFRKKNIVQLVCDGLFEIIDRFSITIFDTGGAISPDFSFMLVIFSVKEINYLQEAI